MSNSTIHDLIYDDDLLVAPGVFDALTAKIVEGIGFEAVYLGGYATGAATGHTEPMLTVTEMCNRAREITANTDLPLIVDGNAGFGDAAHTYRTVNEFAKAGIAAVHIEDQVHPKRLHYHAGIKHVVDTEEMVGKIHAALDSRDDHDEEILIIARTDTARDQRREHEDIEDAVRRVNRYLDAGADAGMIFPSTTDELRYATDAINGPMVFVMHEGREPNLSTDELSDIGVSVSLNALSATVATAKTIHTLYGRLMEQGHIGIDQETFTEYQKLVEDRIGLDKYYEIEERSGKK